MSSTSWWINPCGSYINGKPPALANQWILDEIVPQVRQNIILAKADRDTFAQSLVHKNFDDLYIGQTLEYLPSIGKEYGAEIDKETFKNSMPIEVLKKCYLHLLYSAVAFDQLTMEAQAPVKGEFPTDYVFVNRKFEVKQLLCELLSFAEDHNFSISYTLEPSVMPSIYKPPFNSHTLKAKRDFLLYEYYLNSLEYLQQFLQYIQDIQDELEDKQQNQMDALELNEMFIKAF